MRKYLYVLLGIVTLLVFYKCSSEKEELAEAKEVNGQSEGLSGEDKAWALVEKFAERVNGENSRSLDFSSYKIKKVEKEVIKVDILQQSNLSRTSDVESIDTDVEICKFTIEKDGKQGFAIATSDARIDRVLALVDDGCLADTAELVGMAYMVRGFKYVLAEELQNYYDKEISRASNEFAQEWTLGPCIKTKWNTTQPYNNSYEGSGCPATGNGKYPASTTAVAFAQCVANYPADYDFPAKVLQQYNLSEFVKQETVSAGSPLAAQISSFIKSFEIGAKYDCKGTSTEFNAIQRLNDLGFGSGSYYFFKADDIYVKGIFKSLRFDCPTIVGIMDRDFKMWYSWILDGFWGMATPSLSTIEVTGYHINFCNGGKNDGWWASPTDPSTIGGIPLYPDLDHYFIRTLTFLPVCPWCIMN